MTFHAPIEPAFTPAAYALAYWLAQEGADTTDPQDCERMIYQKASSLTHFGFCLTEALAVVDEAARLTTMEPEAVR